MFATYFASVLFLFAGLAQAAPQSSVTTTLCQGTVKSGTGCIQLPVVGDTCVSFTGGLSLLDQQLSGVAIPFQTGFICFFYPKLNCGTNPNGNVIALSEGVWDMSRVPNTNGATVNFDNKARSFSCSPI